MDAEEEAEAEAGYAEGASLKTRAPHNFAGNDIIIAISQVSTSGKN